MTMNQNAVKEYGLNGDIELFAGEMLWIIAELNLSANVENGIIIFFRASRQHRKRSPGHGPLDYVVHNRKREALMLANR